MMLSSDSQIRPLIEVFELYMLRDMLIGDIREPTTIATRAMLASGLSPELILTILDGAIHVAEQDSGGPSAAVQAAELRGQMGTWLMAAVFDPNTATDRTPMAA
jgi:hypothetical protein